MAELQFLTFPVLLIVALIVATAVFIFTKSIKKAGSAIVILSAIIALFLVFYPSTPDSNGAIAVLAIGLIINGAIVLFRKTEPKTETGTN